MYRVQLYLYWCAPFGVQLLGCLHWDLSRREVEWSSPPQKQGFFPYCALQPLLGFAGTAPVKVNPIGPRDVLLFEKIMQTTVCTTVWLITLVPVIKGKARAARFQRNEVLRQNRRDPALERAARRNKCEG